MEASELEVELIEDEIENIMVRDRMKCMGGKCYHLLEQDWHGIRPVLAVASGGLHPGGIPKLVKRMGHNIVMQFGGGCHGHPMGTKAGAMAIRQALDATLHNIPFEKYARAHHELQRALDKWGFA
jgi:ribulose-bisphosphate carboxylase large chain